jgi:REP element-mobilizing transposase RayT
MRLTKYKFVQARKRSIKYVFQLQRRQELFAQNEHINIKASTILENHLHYMWREDSDVDDGRVLLLICREPKNEQVSQFSNKCLKKYSVAYVQSSFEFTRTCRETIQHQIFAGAINELSSGR